MPTRYNPRVSWPRAACLRAAGMAAAVLVAGWGAVLAGNCRRPASRRRASARSSARSAPVPDLVPAPVPVPVPVSASAERLYEQAKGQLLQVRTLLKGQDSQASVGSGFLVTGEGHILTNYHVVSQAALQPDRYRLVYSTAERREGPLQLLGFDAVHDLAIVKPVDPAPLAGRGTLFFRPRDRPLAQGERIYSLGNPLDVGFAVIEGTYNGLVERSFYPTIFFSGSLKIPASAAGPRSMARAPSSASTWPRAATASKSASWCRPLSPRTCCTACGPTRRSPDPPIRPWSSSSAPTRRRSPTGSCASRGARPGTHATSFRCRRRRSLLRGAAAAGLHQGPSFRGGPCRIDTSSRPAG